MRLIGVIALALVGLISVGYAAGWWSPEPNVNPEVSKTVKEFTQDGLNKAQEHTNSAFDKLKKNVE